MKRKYAIVDIETTGGLSKRDKITEIGIVISDGTHIIDQYESLVNPERLIPQNITRITGITDAMVAEAPKFYEIAKDILEMLEGCIFIAHNVRFDYGFIKEEFRQLGFTFTKRQLCTVVMSKKAFPRLRSYSLGNLIKYFNIEVSARHRALEDAIATTELFHKILDKFDTKDATKIAVKESIQLTKLPGNITLDQLENLPEDCGVYYFLDSRKRIVYIGKSINIKKRVKNHFGKITSKSEKMMMQVADISYEVTGSELVAFLKEAIEIKELQPEINKAQKRYRLPYGIYEDYDKDGYKVLKTIKIDSDKAKDKKIIQSFQKLSHAKSKIKQLSIAFELCLKMNLLEKQKGPCFNYNIGKCEGVCVGSELPFSYNVKVDQALSILNHDFEENFVVIDRGRRHDERATILIEEGQFRGYGYINADDQFLGIEELKESVTYARIIPNEASSIIRNYIWNNNDNVKLIHF